ncbi:MAG: N-acetyltransferase family protein, partial [Hyphomicrobium sp.]
PISVGSRQDWFLAHSPLTHPLRVIEERMRVVAWASVQPFAPAAAFARTVEASVYVAPEAQGRGLGTLMLRTILSRCADVGVEVVLGFAFAHNEATLRLNHRIGFAEWGRLHGVARLDGLDRDLIIFGIKVGPLRLKDER